MRRVALRCALVTAGVALALEPGCSERPLTQLVVVADTDLLVPSQIDGLEVVITPVIGAPVRSAGSLVGGDAVELPASLGVVHRGGPLGPVSIVARGLLGADLVVLREAEVYFVEGRTLLVTLHLEAACVGVPCPDRETCALGACRSVVLSRDELRDFDGSLPHLPDGGGVCVPLPELCNLADDDCDTRIDEGIDLSTDPEHCGVCANACPARANARAACDGGLCTVACESGYGDCNRDPRDGCESALNTLSMCAGCGVECSVAHGAPTCFIGTCDVQSCAPGWGDCNDFGGDGCEAPLNDPTHCGGCAPCVLPGATAACFDGTCGVAACDVGRGDCNGVASDGCEAVLTSPLACGVCGRACPVISGGTVACPAGECVVGSCAPGRADCDASVSNGCETSLDTMSDCGTCGASCALASATERCGVGGCEIVACDAGWGDCNALASDGCETSLETAADCGTCGQTCTGATPLCGQSGTLRTCVSACTGSLALCGSACVETQTSVAHCGGCDRPCAPAHAAGECRAGSCAIAACDPGFGDCNATASDGCETPLDTLANCGACGGACDLSFATERCDAGRCVLSACDAGYGNCDGDGATGCERALRSESDCAGCGVVCDLPFATESCASGTCEIVSCAAGRADCDGLAGDGCEATLGTLTDCRACGDVCDVPMATESCAGGTCALLTCEPGAGDCNEALSDGCERSLTTRSDCGACGVSCGPFPNATATCATGACVRTCDPGFGDCNGIAADGCEAPLSTATDCGACGAACTGATPVCGPSGTGVSCQGSCRAGLVACGSDCADLTTDELHCGACGVPCAPAGATGVCVAGACRISSCAPGLGDCNGAVSDGCERSLRTTTDCSACDVACGPLPGATASCETGACLPICDPGLGDCDGDPTNGCEQAIDTLMSCGGCGITCGPVANAVIACTSGACVIASCAAQRGDCNGIYSDGCETNLRSDGANCGMCGMACADPLRCRSGVCTP